MYIIYEQRLLLGKALLFFFLCSCRDNPSCTFLHSFTHFRAVSLFVSYCHSFLLQSPYFQSPECHKATRQKETQFPELSLQTSSLQLKTATHLCQRMAHFMSDTSASLLLQSVFTNRLHTVVLKALAPEVWNEKLTFHFTDFLFFLQGSASYVSVFFWWGLFRRTWIDVTFKSFFFLTNIWRPGTTAYLWCWHKRILMAARFIGFSELL